MPSGAWPACPPTGPTAGPCAGRGSRRSTSRPGLLGGAQYWSISPSARREEYTPGGLRVGFDDDTEYLGPLERLVLRRVLAVPGAVSRIPNLDESRRVTLAHLTRCRHLRFIS